MQFEKTGKALKIYETLCFCYALVCYLFFSYKSSLTHYFTINVVSFLNFILPTRIYCDIADSISSNITQSGRYHALL